MTVAWNDPAQVLFRVVDELQHGQPLLLFQAGQPACRPLAALIPAALHGGNIVLAREVNMVKIMGSSGGVYYM